MISITKEVVGIQDGPDLQAARFINDFMTQLTEPAMIPAFLAGGMAYRALRWGAAGQWVASPAVKGLSGLFGRQLAASSLALGGETVVFTGTHRAASSLTQSWRGNPPGEQDLGIELAGTGIMLASLRSFGFGFGMIGAALQRSGVAGAGTQFFLSQAGSYTGLLTAQQLEHRLLHPDSPEILNPFSQAAASLIHFTGFGMMARYITPKGWQKVEQQLEQKTLRLLEQKAREIRDNFPPRFGGEGPWAWQGAGLAPIKTLSLRPQGPNPLTQGLFRIEGTPGRRQAVEFWAKLQPETRGLVHDLRQKLPLPGGALMETLAQSQWVDTPRFALALRRLTTVLDYAQAESAQSSYINWITRLGLERILENRDGAALDQMIAMTTEATPRPVFEAFLGNHFPEGRFSLHPFSRKPFLASPDFPRNNSAFAQAIEKLPFSPKAKQTLMIWLLYQNAGDGHTPFFIPQQKFLVHLDYLERMKDLPKWKITEAVLEHAGDSPLGRLKLYRLFQVLRSEMEWDTGENRYVPRGWLGTKLRELVDEKFHIAEPAPGTVIAETDRFAFGAKGGYLGFHGPEALLRGLLPRIPDLTDSVQETQRLQKRRRVMGKFLTQHPGKEAYLQSNLAEAFLQLSRAFEGENWGYEYQGATVDFARHLAGDLQRGHFQLEVLPEAGYTHRFHEVQRAHFQSRGFPYHEKPIAHRSYIFYFDGPQKIPGLDKPLLLVSIPEHNRYSRTAHLDHYFEIMKSAIHEWAHIKEMEQYSQGPMREWNEGAQLKQEAAAHSTHIWFAAQHGDAADLRELASTGLGGYMMRFLDYYEKTYKKFWRG